MEDSVDADDIDVVRVCGDDDRTTVEVEHAMLQVMMVAGVVFDGEEGEVLRAARTNNSDRSFPLAAAAAAAVAVAAAAGQLGMLGVAVTLAC